MKILAFDTSSPQISVAVAEGGKSLSHIDEIGNASVLLVPSIELALKTAGLKLSDIDGFVIGEGPGSYNGLRCGFATLIGLRQPAPKPAVKVSSVESMAMDGKVRYPEFKKCPRYGTILNARKNSFFYAQFDMTKSDDPLSSEGMVTKLEDIPDIKSDSVAWCSYDVEGFRLAYPNAFGLALLGQSMLENGENSILEPRYLRPPV